MYKVFINDKEVRFINEKVNAPTDGQELKTELSSPEIVSHIQLSRDPGVRVFFIQVADPLQRFELFTSYFPIIRAAGGVVRLNDNSGPVLMIHRLGKWDLPKGKIDKGEESEKAAVREVEEECGIKNLKIVKRLSNSCHLYEFKGVTVLKETHWYLMLTDYTGNLIPQLEEGITEVKWVYEKDIYFLLPGAYSSIADLLSKEILNC